AARPYRDQRDCFSGTLAETCSETRLRPGPRRLDIATSSCKAPVRSVGPTPRTPPYSRPEIGPSRLHRNGILAERYPTRPLLFLITPGDAGRIKSGVGLFALDGTHFREPWGRAHEPFNSTWSIGARANFSEASAEVPRSCRVAFFAIEHGAH